MNTIRPGSALVCFGPSNGIPIAQISLRKPYSYALTKNLTYEPAGTGVQSSPGQHSIIPTAVSDGDTCNCDVIQNRRLQFSRPVCIRVGGREYCPHGHR